MKLRKLPKTICPFCKLPLGDKPWSMLPIRGHKGGVRSHIACWDASAVDDTARHTRVGVLPS